MHHPRRVVRGPPLGKTLGPRRQDRCEGRGAALLLAPPPSPRRHLRLQPDAQRRHPLQQEDVKGQCSGAPKLRWPPGSLELVPTGHLQEGLVRWSPPCVDDLMAFDVIIKGGRWF